LTRLTFVSLCSHNNLTGNFPSFDTGFFARQVIGLSHNLLVGPLPQFAASAAELSIDLSLIRIHTIDISYNFLTGTVDPNLWFIPTIRHVDMAGNMFTGALEITAGAFSY
jgi:hypothetical protein